MLIASKRQLDVRGRTIALLYEISLRTLRGEMSGKCSKGCTKLSV